MVEGKGRETLNKEVDCRLIVWGMAVEVEVQISQVRLARLIWYKSKGCLGNIEHRNSNGTVLSGPAEILENAIFVLHVTVQREPVLTVLSEPF